jgi:hypothetical protein
MHSVSRPRTTCYIDMSYCPMAILPNTYGPEIRRVLDRGQPEWRPEVSLSDCKRLSDLQIPEQAWLTA